MLVLVQAVFKFGYGLSFTSFTYKPSSSVVGPVSLRPVQALLAEAAKAGTPFVPTAGAEADPIVRFSVAVTNTGDVARQSPPPPFVARLFPVSWYLLERASDARGVQNAVFTRTMREHCMWHGFQHSTLFFFLFCRRPRTMVSWASCTHLAQARAPDRCKRSLASSGSMSRLVPPSRRCSTLAMLPSPRPWRMAVGKCWPVHTRHRSACRRQRNTDKASPSCHFRLSCLEDRRPPDV